MRRVAGGIASGSLLGVLLGLAWGIAHGWLRVLEEGGTAPEYDVLVAVTAIEAGSLGAIGFLLGGLISLLGLKLPLLRTPGAYVGLVLIGTTLIRLGIGAMSRAETSANRNPIPPDEPVAVVAALSAAAAIWVVLRWAVGNRRALAGKLVLAGSFLTVMALMGLGITSFTARPAPGAPARVDSAVVAQRWGLSTSAEHPPNVLIVSIDALRADFLGSYGNPLVKTPNLDRLAVEGARFSAMTTVQPTTLPTFLSLFSGVYPATHRGRSHIGSLLPDRFDTLAMVMKAGGYQTAGFITYIGLRPEYSNLQRGFDTYQDTTQGLPPDMADPLKGQAARLAGRLLENVPLAKLTEDLVKRTSELETTLWDRADITTDAALGWLRARPSPAPFFLWVHYFGPHYPFTPPPPFDTVYDPQYAGSINGDWPTIRLLQEGGQLSERDIQHVRALYGGEVAYNDQEVGRLFRELQSSGEWDRTVVIALADEGESLGEKGQWFHNIGVSQVMSAVPLLIRYPTNVPAGTVVDAPVQTIDVFPTVLDLVGIGGRGGLEGQSLAPLMSRATSGDDRAAIVERGDRAIAGVRWRDWKLVVYPAEDRVVLYDVRKDPLEYTELQSQYPEVVRQLRERFNAWYKAHP
jgi:arylsulfatase A-like enzyme